MVQDIQEILAGLNVKTKYVAFLDDDDYWHKDKIKIQLDIFNSLKNIDLVACKKKYKGQKIDLKKINKMQV